MSIRLSTSTSICRALYPVRIMGHFCSRPLVLSSILTITAIGLPLAPSVAQDEPLNIFIGGSGSDSGVAAQMLPGGDIIALLTTSSTGLPTHDDAVLTDFAGGLSDAYVIRFSSETMEVRWGTYYGADGFDAGHDLVCSESSNTCTVVGEGMGVMPGTEDANPENTSTDAWVAVFDLTSGALLWADQIEEQFTQWFNGLLTCASASNTKDLWAYATDRACLVGEAKLDCVSSNGHHLAAGLCLSRRPDDAITAKPVFFGQRGLDPSITIAGIGDVGKSAVITQTIIPRPGFSGYEEASAHGNRVIAVENVFEDESQQPVDQSVAHCHTIDDLFMGSDEPGLQDLGEPAYAGFDFDGAGHAWSVRDDAGTGIQTEEAFLPRQGSGCEQDMVVGMAGQVVPAMTQLQSYSATMFQSMFVGRGRFTDIPGFLTPTPILTTLSFGSAAQISIVPAPTKYVQFINTDDGALSISTRFSPAPGSEVSPAVLDFQLEFGQASPFLMLDPLGSFSATITPDGAVPVEVASGSEDDDVTIYVVRDGRVVPFPFEKPDIGPGGESLTVLNLTGDPLEVETLDESGERIEFKLVDDEESEQFGDLDRFLLGLGLVLHRKQRVPLLDEHPLLAVAAVFLFADEAAAKGQSAEVRLFDQSGAPLDYEIVVTSAETAPELPHSRLTVDTFPNPFATSTTIAFDLPESGHVKLEIFDQLGRRVATVVDGMRASGWNSVGWDGRGGGGVLLPAGLYLYRLESAATTRSGTIVLAN